MSRNRSGKSVCGMTLISPRLPWDVATSPIKTHLIFIGEVICDIHVHPFPRLDGCRLYHCADGLGNLALLANDAAHVFRSHVEPIDSLMLFVYLLHANVLGMLHKGFRNKFH